MYIIYIYIGVTLGVTHTGVTQVLNSGRLGVTHKSVVRTLFNSNKSTSKITTMITILGKNEYLLCREEEDTCSLPRTLGEMNTTSSPACSLDARLRSRLRSASPCEGGYMHVCFLVCAHD